MKLFTYAWLHLSRNLKNSCIALVSYLCVLLVILSIQTSAQSRQRALVTMAQSIDIQGNAADIHGYTTVGLQMDSLYALQFLDEDKLLTRYVKDVRVMGVYDGEILLPDKEGAYKNATQCTLKAVTREDADEAVRYGSGFTYLTGADEQLLLTDQMVCIVSPDLMQFAIPDAEGNLYIHVQASFYHPSFYYYSDLSFALRVVGSCEDTSNTVYAPFRAVLHTCQEQNASCTVDSLSFTVQDNEQLDVLRNMVNGYFQDARTTTATRGYSLVLKDARYLKLLREAEKNLAVMQLMQPILYLCALGAGVMLVVMQMRSRKKEMAVIRSLGAGRLRVMAQSI
ncbi:MAG: hypothetical protein E7326_01210, partial [Clostridiales bacterium]|nr:hypothetical protein [Clostridiales bacterium]